MKNKTKIIIGAITTLCLLLIIAFFIFFHGGKVNELGQVMTVDTADSIGEEKYEYNVGYNTKFKSKELSEFGPSARGKVKKGRATPSSLLFFSSKDDSWDSSIIYDFKKRTLTYEYNSGDFDNIEDGITEVVQKYSITSSGKIGKLLSQHVKRGYQDKKLSTKSLLSILDDSKKAVKQLENSGYTYDVLKERVSLDLKNAPSLAKKQKKAEEKKQKEEDDTSEKIISKYQKKFETKMREEAFRTTSFTQEDWLRYVEIRMQQLGIKVDSLKRVYSDTLESGYYDKLVVESTLAAEYIQTIPNTYHSSGGVYVEINAQGKTYIASFPSTDWLYKPNKINELSFNTTGQVEPYAFMQDYETFYDAANATSEKDVPKLSEMMSQYFMEDDHPSDSDIAHNISIFEIDKTKAK